MLSKNLYNELVIPLKTSDTGDTALLMMEDLKVSHLPVVGCEKYLGVISELDILNLDNPSAPIGNQRQSFSRPYVLQSQHFYEVVRVAAS